MKLQELDQIFKINPQSLTKLNDNKLARWGNIDTHQLAEKIFDNLAQYFPECHKTSTALNKRIYSAIRLAFMKVNQQPSWKNPAFKDFITCCLMTTGNFQPQNNFDQQWLSTLIKASVLEDIPLAS